MSVSSNAVNNPGGEEILLEDSVKSELHCLHCHEILSIPILLLDGTGNMCQKCFKTLNEKEVELKGIPNNALNALLKALDVPCKYQPSGCQSVLTYDDKFMHEKNCIYQTFECLNVSQISSPCDWKGAALHFSDHFIETHESDIVEIVSNKFNFELSLSECNNYPLVRLLKNQNVCLFFVATVKDDKMFYKVCDGKNNDTPAYEYVEISHIGLNGTYNVKCKVGTLLEHTETEQNLSLLTHFTFTEDVLELQVENISDSICIVSNKISHHFECPVCKMLMFSTIYMCKTGHSFCRKCKSKLTSCPVCRGSIEDSRNFALENISADLLYPCGYECGQFFLGSQLRSHMHSCVCKTFICPTDKFCGSYDSIKKHFREYHLMTSSFTNTQTYRITLKGGWVDFQNKFIFYENQVFVIRCRKMYKKVKWGVYNINSSQTNNKCRYIYEISVINLNDESQRLIVSSHCQKSKNLDVNKVPMNNDCMVTLGFESLMPYADKTSKIKVNCAIKRT